MPFNCYRRSVCPSNVKRAQRPTGGRIRVRRIVEQRSRLFRRDDHRELVEGLPQPVAPRFAVCLLAGPASEERRQSRFWRKRAEQDYLRWGEVSFSYRFPRRLSTNALHVHAELTPASHCDERKLMGVGQVECEALAWRRWREGGLSTRGGA